MNKSHNNHKNARTSKWKKRFDKKPTSSKFNQTKKECQHQNQLQESEVGITEYISKLEGFSAIMKARYSDFQVNEIDLNGKIAKLTDLTIPEEFQQNVEESINIENNTESPIKEIPQNTWNSIIQLIKSENDDNEKVELEVTKLSKEERKAIYEYCRQFLSGKIVAKSLGREENTRFIEFRKFSKSDKIDNRFRWPDNKGEYVHFLLYKESLDTMEACMKISDVLKMKASNFNYCGTKDKRAKTTQWVSVKRVNPNKLIYKTKILYNVKIGNITLMDHPLKLGQLSGNKFRIALRNVQGSDELTQEALEGLKQKGFINYYGLQRFGNDKEVPTYSIGIQLMLGNWKEACSIILKLTKSDDPDSDITKAKKKYFETQDAFKALEQFDRSKNKCIEWKLLFGLNKNGANDYVNSLENIPRNVRLLYIHSFQSLIWNQMASKRIQKFGLSPVEGDLILINEHKLESTPENSDDDSLAVEQQSKQEIKSLSSEDCSNYSIYDVVLPLPGYDVIYPDNMKENYKEILETHGLSLEMSKQKVQTYNLSGTYRKLLGQVQDLSWKIMHYDDPNYNLIRSDLEELKGLPEPNDIKDGQYKALVVEFSLNSSSYATMVLREILKTDTSSSSHAKLNNYFSNKNDASEKKILMNDVDSKQSDDSCFSGQESLLNDAKKYEEFKNSIFNFSETAQKRNIEECAENGGEEGSNKKLKQN